MSDSRLFQVESSSSGYTWLFPLSEGGMGQVDLVVRQEGRFRRLYAIKRMLPALRHDEAARAMFLEEARLAGLLQSPHVVGVLDVGEDADGPFLAMEYVDGVTVREIVTQARAEELLLPVQLCCRIVAEAALGLEAAHAARSLEGDPLHLVHRDVSPQNILVGFDGVTRVVDFGIARALGRDHKTNTGVLKGKLGYMAPELLRFEKPSARSDIFSLGIVLFEMVAGTRLYGGKDDAERARRIVSEDPPQLSEHREDVSPALEALVIAMLAKDPEHRPLSARAIADTLNEVTQSLVPEDGALDVAEYLDDAFRDMRAERQSRVREELLERASESTSLPTTLPHATPHGTRDARVLRVVVVLALIAGTVGLMAYLRSEPVAQVEEPSRQRSTSSPSAAQELPPPEPLPAPVADVPEPTAAMTRPRARRRRPRPAVMTPVSMRAAAMTKAPSSAEPPSWGFER